MEWYWWLLIAILCLAVLVFAAAYYCYRRIFYSPKRIPLKEDEYEIPDGEIYEAYREEIIDWVKKARATPHEDMSVVSFDGLALRGRYYEYQAGAPLEILFHGYRGDGERDLSAGIERCFALGRNVIIVDQRASGRSDGKVVTFGIKERLDCVKWVEYAIERFGKDVTIILGGVSMGAATVLMAAGEELPANVVCVMADCGYSSPRAIIQKVIREMKLPARFVYPFVRFGARIFGRFGLDSNSPMEVMKRCKLPVILIHGDADDFVPCEMSQELFDACVSPKQIKIIKGAGHGLAYPVNKQEYLQALADFEKLWKK